MHRVGSPRRCCQGQCHRSPFVLRCPFLHSLSGVRSQTTDSAIVLQPNLVAENLNRPPGICWRPVAILRSYLLKLLLLASVLESCKALTITNDLATKIVKS